MSAPSAATTSPITMSSRPTIDPEEPGRPTRQITSMPAKKYPTSNVAVSGPSEP
jgi:hypothetical protein